MDYTTIRWWFSTHRLSPMVRWCKQRSKLLGLRREHSSDWLPSYDFHTWHCVLVQIGGKEYLWIQFLLEYGLSSIGATTKSASRAYHNLVQANWHCASWLDCTVRWWIPIGWLQDFSQTEWPCLLTDQLRLWYDFICTDNMHDPSDCFQNVTIWIRLGLKYLC